MTTPEREHSVFTRNCECESWLAKELWDAARNEGKSISVREQTHRMAEANRAFAHFAR